MSEQVLLHLIFKEQVLPVGTRDPGTYWWFTNIRKKESKQNSPVSYGSAERFCAVSGTMKLQAKPKPTQTDTQLPKYHPKCVFVFE